MHHRDAEAPGRVPRVGLPTFLGAVVVLAFAGCSKDNAPKGPGADSVTPAGQGGDAPSGGAGGNAAGTGGLSTAGTDGKATGGNGASTGGASTGGTGGTSTGGTSTGGMSIRWSYQTGGTGGTSTGGTVTGGKGGASTGGTVTGGKGGASTGGTATGGKGGTSTGGTSPGGMGGTSTGGAALFFDDFLGSTLDTSKWTIADRMSDQANNEVNACVPANVVVSGGRLQITARHEDAVSGDRAVNPPHAFLSTQTFHYTSGHIQQATAPFLYGTVSARIRPPAGQGVWPCFWMLGFEWHASQPYTANVAGLNWPVDGWCETDIAEFMGGVRTSANTQLHYNSAHPGGQSALPFDASTRFMVYRLQWSPNSMIWSVDAEDANGFRTLRTVTGAGNVPNVAQYVVLNMAVGGNGGGTDLSGPWPMTMEVDWVRVTQP